MRILVAPDSFKGCLSSIEVCRALTEGIKEFDPNIEVIQFPSSDGGEGFCDCMMNLFGGERIKKEVKGPLGADVKADYIYNETTHIAYIEFASASGLNLVADGCRSILNSTSFGVGELIKDAVLRGAKSITIGLGGSATNDCGIGLLSALGMEFYDEQGCLLEAIPKNLDSIHSVSKANMLDLSKIEIVAACDVKNPLCGENGAARVFARQKGADDEEIEFLDFAASKFVKALGVSTNVAGYGAAGGAGMAIMAILGASYVSGAEILVNSLQFQESLKTANIVITGEGNTDSQSSFGKLVSVVINASKSMNIKSIVISGGLSKGYEALGADAYYSLCNHDVDKEYSMKHAFALIKDRVKTALINN